MWLESLAKKRPVNFAASMPAREQSKLCVLHTNGGPCDHGSLFSFFNRAGNDICSHFQVANDGSAEQYIATEHVAYAAFASNAYAVQIETEDDGNPATPWTAAQIAKIVAILHALKVPAQVAPDGPGSGVGWHSLYADWNQDHHNCPGAVRVSQIHNFVIPALRESYVDFRALKAAGIKVAGELSIPHPGVNPTTSTLGPPARKMLIDIAKS
jgi:hypothetical protein